MEFQAPGYLAGPRFLVCLAQEASFQSSEGFSPKLNLFLFGSLSVLLTTFSPPPHPPHSFFFSFFHFHFSNLKCFSF